MTAPHRRTAGLTALAVLATTVVLGIAGPAAALPVECGVALVGVDSNYVADRANGHPAGEPDDLDGWGGSEPVVRLQRAIFALERSDDLLEAIVGLADTSFDNPPTKVVQLATAVVRTVLHTTVQSLQVVALGLEQRNADVDACSSALAGDFADVFWTAVLERDLATLDLSGEAIDAGAEPAPGTALVPAAMFVLPQDGWPAWHDESHLYTDAEGHPSADIFYSDGALNGQYIGVAVTVRNQIAYMEASGIDTGVTTTTTDPNTGQAVTVYGARDLWHQAMDLMAQGHLQLAYVRFAEAYQRAVTQSPPPGATHPTATSSPTPQPAPTATSAPAPTAWPTAEPTPQPTPGPTPAPAPTDPWR